MSDPLYVEPVIGYRSWWISDQFHLRSRSNRDCFWPADQKLTARCSPEIPFKVTTDLNLPFVHEPVQIGCTCGIYGFHELYDAIDKYGTGHRSVIGACVYWGKIVVCTAGFRAQHARIVALTDYRHKDRVVDLGWNDTLEGVVEKYNVPVVPKDLLEQYAETWGKPLAL